ncbi:MAG TPA: matrixin family metalloprotease [Bryobacteraceae bacterium]|nr:matrixin family metalloprotease [Bryobacteraceae bacterium]
MGARIVGYIPDSGVIVSVPDGARLDSLDIVAASALRIENKVSADLDEDTSAFVVEFHRDVDAADIHLLLHEEHLEEHYHPDLLPHHALVYGDLAGARRIAAWDEVSYVYPASAALTNAVRVNVCPGPLTVYGPIGQAVSSVGDGWDGAGLGSVNLGYAFGTLTSRTPRAQTQAELLRALSEWAKYVNVRFAPAASPYASRTLSILFANGEHGDGYPFDGSGRVLAHTFYPAPPNPESLAGDMHFDNAESWNIGSDVDIYSVALHEAGHALGLGHSDRSSSVMYPYYTRATGLAAEDIAAIRLLYASRQSTPADTPDDPVTPSNPAVPDTPSNPTKPATPSTDVVPPTLRITVPGSVTSLTSSATLTLAGTAADRVGVTKVIWTDSLGNNGAASGTTVWKAAGVPLRVGSNRITVRAYDAAGNSSWRAVLVTRRQK